jgi:hypothetical protein
MQACPVQPQWKRPFADRLVAAIRLDATVYDEVENDPEAIGQAFWVVVLASFAQGLGAIDAPSIPALLGGLMGVILAGIVGWVVGAALVWAIGVKLMGCTSDYGELLRTMGFASAPKILLLIGVLPLGAAEHVLGVLILILTTVAAVLAVRQALDVTTGRAVVVCVVAAVASFVVAGMIGAVIGIALGLGVIPGEGTVDLPLPSIPADPDATPITDGTAVRIALDRLRDAWTTLTAR